MYLGSAPEGREDSQTFPLKLLATAVGDIPQQDRFGQRSGIAEISSAWCTCLACRAAPFTLRPKETIIAYPTVLRDAVCIRSSIAGKFRGISCRRPLISKQAATPVASELVVYLFWSIFRSGGTQTSQSIVALKNAS